MYISIDVTSAVESTISVSLICIINPSSGVSGIVVWPSNSNLELEVEPLCIYFLRLDAVICFNVPLLSLTSFTTNPSPSAIAVLLSGVVVPSNIFNSAAVEVTNIPANLRPFVPSWEATSKSNAPLETVKLFDIVVAPVNVLAFEPVCVREWLNDKAAPLTVNPSLKSPLPKATSPTVPLNISPEFVASAIKVNLLVLSS